MNSKSGIECVVGEDYRERLLPEAGGSIPELGALIMRSGREVYGEMFLMFAKGDQGVRRIFAIVESWGCGIEGLLWGKSCGGSRVYFCKAAER